MAQAAADHTSVLLVLWGVVSGLYALTTVLRVLRHDKLGLATLSATLAIGAVWLYLIDRTSQPSTRTHIARPPWSALRIVTLTFCATVAVLNGIIMVHALRHGEPFPLVRFISTACLLYAVVALCTEVRRPPGSRPPAQSTLTETSQGDYGHRPE